eukprot:CAMPEP_0179001468 /NCGR_PEP_ID=MMETSP0795-20121207/11384_1 /TAXON_ID=88552 /ORGANISM="Amoebophrya sp., Strain Ameob2" /LENGTH=92 /DNA_ID=CAMNT_0020694859 /DNA_START=78 /DNA_END=353 /DNA_ORIENTATION=-
MRQGSICSPENWNPAPAPAAQLSADAESGVPLHEALARGPKTGGTDRDSVFRARIRATAPPGSVEFSSGRKFFSRLQPRRNAPDPTPGVVVS